MALIPRILIQLIGGCRYLMGRLAGFRYRGITRRLIALGLEFHRHAAD